jgi:hypothetical protein
MDEMGRLGYDFKSVYINYEYPLLWFFKLFPDYDQYWYVDYDVRFTGDWSLFFNSFSPSDGYDLLATHVAYKHENPHWGPHWDESSVVFERPIRIFFSLARFSKPALTSLDRNYRKKISGFCELVVPSVLLQDGLKIGDFWGLPQHRVPYIKKRFYSIFTCHWRPIMFFAGIRRNFIYHPVKLPSERNGWGRDILRENWRIFKQKIQLTYYRIGRGVKKSWLKA